MASKSKHRGKVLAASCFCAAVMVAGSSFAWFTSRDEVTNKLSAKSEFDVVPVEDFSPPQNWTPGNEVNKDVKVTNTGNVDAFVKLSVTNDMSLTYKAAAGDATFTADNVSNYIELDADQVKSLKAGGRLVYKKAGAFTAADLVTVEANKMKGTDVATTDAGLYIFERNTTYTDAGAVDTVDFVGFYCDGNGKNYAVTVAQTNKAPSGYTIDKTKTEQVTPALKYVAAAGTVPAHIEATITKVTGKEIKINIGLNADGLSKWDAPANNATDEVFYYKEVLKAGTTTANQLIDSVTLDSGVEADAYISFDYNLRVAVDSAQVVDDRTTAGTAVSAVNAQNWGKNATYVSDTNVTWAAP